MRIHSDFEPYIHLVIEVLKQYKVKSAYLFGSVLTNRFNENSDLDVLVDFENFTDDPIEKGENIWNLQFALEDILNRPVDLVNEANLKNPYFIKELQETKYRIYG